MKRRFAKLGAALLALLMCLSLAACGEQNNSSSTSTAGTEDPKEIKLGCLSIFNTYMDELASRLEEKGYSVEVVRFDANNMAAIACKDGDINGFIHNHLPWIETFNKENNSNLTMMKPYLGYYRFAMYSNQYDRVEDIPDGATIAIPNDPTNLENSLLLLQQLGLIKLGDKLEDFYTVLDITENPKNLKLLETDVDTTARNIDSAAAVICPATRVQVAGIDPNSFLAEDETTVNFPVGLTVREEDQNQTWIQDALEIMQSDEMRAKADEIFQGTFPLYDKEA